jgi:hypothetical protein
VIALALALALASRTPDIVMASGQASEFQKSCEISSVDGLTLASQARIAVACRECRNALDDNPQNSG